MIGIVLTGHGEFSIGLLHALEMIVGNQESFKVVPFFDGKPIEQFENDIDKEVGSLVEECGQVVIFCDLLGGSPFKAAMMIASKYEFVEVICGTNLPMLIEISINRQYIKTALELAEQAIITGQNSIQRNSLSSTLMDEDE